MTNKLVWKQAEHSRKAFHFVMFCLLFLSLGAAADLSGNDFCFLEEKCGKELAKQHTR